MRHLTSLLMLALSLLGIVCVFGALTLCILMLGWVVTAALLAVLYGAVRLAICTGEDVE